jgi:hypothetical protein
LDESNTEYIHIEIFLKDPSDLTNSKDQFNIIKKHTGKKYRLKSNLRYLSILNNKVYQKLKNIQTLTEKMIR